MPDVANYLDVSPATISNYEHGYTFPSVPRLNKLKTLYGEPFIYCMSKIHDHGKKPYLNFRGSDIPDSDNAELSFEQKHYPKLAFVKEYLKELDSQNNS